MPWPMVHFAVAERLFGDRVTPAFVLGSIAPDAIHMRNGTTRDDKRVTHLYQGKFRPDRGRLERFAAEQTSGCHDVRRLDFIRGYAAHIWTDVLWVDQIYMVVKNSLLNEGASDEEVKTAYNLESAQLDFYFYNRAEWRGLLFAKLKEARAEDLSPLLTAPEIDKWRSRTLHWFDSPSKEPHIELRFLTEDRIERFVADAARDIGEMLRSGSFAGK